MGRTYPMGVQTLTNLTRTWAIKPNLASFENHGVNLPEPEISSLHSKLINVIYMHFDRLGKRNAMVKSIFQFKEDNKPFWGNWSCQIS